ncbi:hypothetical protein AVEN_17747-1 [Araneus ventricosus]|uniref:Uncharacterized protein n=1 Tax=Araneus ventricosus TaxID=182803 RepID=A0A4Y2TB64_ARAVE|nr:hypothetical protein AVEN_17747-1 [Araneus ventricosus]
MYIETSDLYLLIKMLLITRDCGDTVRKEGEELTGGFLTLTKAKLNEVQTLGEKIITHPARYPVHVRKV